MKNAQEGQKEKEGEWLIRFRYIKVSEKTRNRALRLDHDERKKKKKKTVTTPSTPQNAGRAERRKVQQYDLLRLKTGKRRENAVPKERAPLRVPRLC